MGLHLSHREDAEVQEEGAVRGAREEIRDVLRKSVAAKESIEIVEDSVCVDYIHMCLRIAPKYAVAKVMGYLKGKSTLIMFDHHSEWGR